MQIYFTVKQIKDANKAAGLHWFDPDTNRFFASRSSGPVIGNMFVSSERDRETGSGRLYTIRLCKDGEIETVGQFQQYATKAAALRALRTVAEDNHRADVFIACNFGIGTMAERLDHLR